MLLEIPDNIWNRLELYAKSRRSDAESLAIKFINERIPPSARPQLTCCYCGTLYPDHKGKKRLFCSEECYKNHPFPRIGITMQAVQAEYGMPLREAAENLGLSRSYFEKVVKKMGLRDRFNSRG